MSIGDGIAALSNMGECVWSSGSTILHNIYLMQDGTITGSNMGVCVWSRESAVLHRICCNTGWNRCGVQRG